MTLFSFLSPPGCLMCTRILLRILLVLQSVHCLPDTVKLCIFKEPQMNSLESTQLSTCPNGLN